MVEGVLLVLAACRQDPLPELTLAVLPPPPGLPLVRVVTATADASTRVELVVDDGSDVWTLVREAGDDRPFELTRLHPDRDVVLIGTPSRDGRAGASVTATFHTDPLPPDFPTVTVRQSRPAEMEPGDTLLSVFRDPPPRYAAILDPDGERSRCTSSAGTSWRWTSSAG
jgi:hypothetical protein